VNSDPFKVKGEKNGQKKGKNVKGSSSLKNSKLNPTTKACPDNASVDYWSVAG